MPRARSKRRPAPQDRAPRPRPPLRAAALLPVVEVSEEAEAETLGDHITEVLQDVSFPIPMHRLIDEAGERVVELDDGSVHDLVELLGGARPRVFRSIEEVVDAIQSRMDLDARDAIEEPGER